MHCYATSCWARFTFITESILTAYCNLYALPAPCFVTTFLNALRFDYFVCYLGRFRSWCAMLRLFCVLIRIPHFYPLKKAKQKGFCGVLADRHSTPPLFSQFEHLSAQVASSRQRFQNFTVPKVAGLTTLSKIA